MGRVRASRLVTLLGLLQARGRMSTRQLAAELEVCERTVLRDIEALSGAGIPVYATRGRHGGFELLDGFTSRLAGVTRRGAALTPSAVAGSGPAAPAPAAPGGVQRALIRLSPRGRRPRRCSAGPPGCTSAVTPPAAARAGWIDAWVRIESPEAAVLDLLALGAEVEVVRPPALRAELARVARRIADLHSDGTAAP